MLLFLSGIGMQEVLIIFSLLVLWIVGIVDVASSNFRDDSTKVLWLMFIVFAPFIGIVLYMIIGRKQRIDKR
jgi:hypothetical protein